MSHTQQIIIPKMKHTVDKYANIVNVVANNSGAFVKNSNNERLQGRGIDYLDVKHLFILRAHFVYDYDLPLNYATMCKNIMHGKS